MFFLRASCDVVLFVAPFPVPRFLRFPKLSRAPKARRSLKIPEVLKVPKVHGRKSG